MFIYLKDRNGSALIVALWALIILSLLIVTFAYEMKVESGVTSFYRKRMKAQYLARAGVEWAKVLLARSLTVSESDIADTDIEQGLIDQAIRLSRGVAVMGHGHNLGDGFFSVDIIPETGRRNVNLLNDEDWEEILDQANVPEERWDELIDCFSDWIDSNDEHHLNGAESDDSFYEERGYECKNAPLDTVDELLLIKGFDYDVVYGGPAEDEDDAPMLGIASWLTVWGDGKVNVNTATREVLLTIPGIDEWMVDEILSGRDGFDSVFNTRDDGFHNVDDVVGAAGLPPEIAARISTIENRFVRIVSIGEAQDVRAGIWAVVYLGNRKVEPVFWREENMH